ncbi:phenol hydroxylase subunit [Leeia sp. TBRC 13508]|uniref:Phenol hydroxylase subunit n=1 Tax=Leeia speluncae TaxID=2884804 RepID=A0ABS8D9U3_9NEIS|nr:phenol hydroxylase subunit [Leeia speluncae]MCB6184917.1 phenol hydroxylase subunit [Leeia speluncae]
MDHPSTFDLNKKYVRIMEEQSNGLVLFEFSVGEPEMMVELVMPKPAFAEFCEKNQVIFLTNNPAPSTDSASNSDWNWRLSDATNQRFRDPT